MKYLIENPEIEHEILQNFDQYLDKTSNFLSSLGIHPRYSWYLIEIQTEKLIPTVIGDVDILAGKLELEDLNHFQELLTKFRNKNPKWHPISAQHFVAAESAWNGGLKWTPSLDYLVGIEVKSCYLPPTAKRISVDEIKSQKSSQKAIKKIRNQTDKLLKMGFNKVGLFEFIANPPSVGIGNEPWWSATSISGRSFDAMEEVFNQRLYKDSPVGHGICSFGGVWGKKEVDSGAYTFPVLRQAKDNPNLAEKKIKDNRFEMEKNLAEIFQSMPKPLNIPAVFVYEKRSDKFRFINKGVTSI